MTYRTKKRTDDLQAIAAQLLATSGADISQGVAIRPLVRAMVKITGCAYQTAKRHIELAIQRAQHK